MCGFLPRFNSQSIFYKKMFFCFLQLKNDEPPKWPCLVRGLFFSSKSHPRLGRRENLTFVCFLRPFKALLLKWARSPVYVPCKKWLWCDSRVLFFTSGNWLLQKVPLVPVKTIFYKKTTCDRLQKSSKSPPADQKVPVARLPCLLFGPPPPAAPLIGAPAPSRAWPPRSSLT